VVPDLRLAVTGSVSYGTEQHYSGTVLPRVNEESGKGLCRVVGFSTAAFRFCSYVTDYQKPESQRYRSRERYVIFGGSIFEPGEWSLFKECPKQFPVEADALDPFPTKRYLL
jgi:hypothetical protein